MPSPHCVGLRSYYCQDSPSSQKPSVRLRGGKGRGREAADQNKSINSKFLDWPKRGTPGSKWVTFMLPDANETDVTCRRWESGSTGTDTVLNRCMWVSGANLSPQISQWEQSNDAALTRSIPVFFTVNPQWSHQHWYACGCEILCSPNVQERISVTGIPKTSFQFPILTYNYIYTLAFIFISSANVSSGAHLQHCHSIHFH